MLKYCHVFHEYVDITVIVKKSIRITKNPNIF